MEWTIIPSKHFSGRMISVNRYTHIFIIINRNRKQNSKLFQVRKLFEETQINSNAWRFITGCLLCFFNNSVPSMYTCHIFKCIYRFRIYSQMCMHMGTKLKKNLSLQVAIQSSAIFQRHVPKKSVICCAKCANAKSTSGIFLLRIPFGNCHILVSSITLYNWNFIGVLQCSTFVFNFAC